LFNFRNGEDVWERSDSWGFNDVDPLPILFKDMLPEKLKTVTVNLDGTPGMGVNQFLKIFFPLFNS